MTGLFTWNATGSAFLVATMTMLRLLPMGLFGAFLGAWAERVEGRTALLLTVAGSLLGSLAVATHGQWMTGVSVDIGTSFVKPAGRVGDVLTAKAVVTGIGASRHPIAARADLC